MPSVNLKQICGRETPSRQAYSGSNSSTQQNLRSDVVLVLISVFYVFLRLRRGFPVPEEPGMLDYSYTLDALTGGGHQWEQLSFADQSTLVLWGLVSRLTHLIGLGLIEHYFLIYVIRTSTILILARRLFALRADTYTSFFCTLMLFAVTPIRVAPLYAHWWSHVVLLIGILLFMMGSSSTPLRRHIPALLVLLISTIAVWANLPHLIAAWIALPVSIYVLHSEMRLDTHSLRKALLLIGLALLVYLVPFAVYTTGLDQLRLIAASNVATFGNFGVWHVLQGYAGWWYFTDYCIGMICQKLEPIHFELMSTPRQVVRGLLLLVMTSWYLLEALQKRRLKDDNGARPVGHDLIVPIFITFFLSWMGASRLYFELRNSLPSLLQVFREPYPKFSPLFYILVFLFIAARISLLKTFRIRLLGMLTAPVVVFLIYPIFQSYESTPLLISRQEWKEIERSGPNLEVLPPNSCVFDVSQNRDIAAFFQARYSSVHADLRHLRVTWVNEAYQRLGIEIDGPDRCLTRTLAPFAVLKPLAGKSPKALTNVYFANDNRRGAPTCVRSDSKYITTYNRHCIFAIESKGSGKQTNNVFIDMFDKWISLRGYGEQSIERIDQLYIENYDASISHARVMVMCNERLREYLLFDLRIDGEQGLVIPLDGPAVQACHDLRVKVSS